MIPASLFGAMGKMMNTSLGRMAMMQGGSMLLGKVMGGGFMNNRQQQNVQNMNNMNNLFNNPVGMTQNFLNSRAMSLRDKVANASYNATYQAGRFTRGIGGADKGFDSTAKVIMGATFGGVMAATPQATRAYGQEYALAERGRRLGEMTTRGLMNVADYYTLGASSKALRYSGAEAGLLGRRNIGRNIEQLSNVLNQEDIGSSRISSLGRGFRRGTIDDSASAGIDYGVSQRRIMHQKFGYSTEQIDRMQKLADSSMSIGQVKRSARADKSGNLLARQSSDLTGEFASAKRQLNLTGDEVKGLFDTLRTLGDVTAKGAASLTSKLKGYRREAGVDMRTIVGSFTEQTAVAGQNFLGKKYGDYAVQNMIRGGRAFTNKSVPQSLIQHFGGDNSQGRAAYGRYLSNVGVNMLDSGFGMMTTTMMHAGTSQGLGLGTNYNKMMKRFGQTVSKNPFSIFNAMIDPEARGAAAAAAPKMKIMAQVDMMRRYGMKEGNIAGLAAQSLKDDFGGVQMAGAQVKAYLGQEKEAKAFSEDWAKKSKNTGIDLGKDFANKLMDASIKNNVDVKDITRLAKDMYSTHRVDILSDVKKGKFNYKDTLALKDALTGGKSMGLKGGQDLTILADMGAITAVNERATSDNVLDTMFADDEKLDPKKFKTTGDKDKDILQLMQQNPDFFSGSSGIEDITRPIAKAFFKNSENISRASKRVKGAIDFVDRNTQFNFLGFDFNLSTTLGAAKRLVNVVTETSDNVSGLKRSLGAGESKLDRWLGSDKGKKWSKGAKAFTGALGDKIGALYDGAGGEKIMTNLFGEAESGEDMWKKVIDPTKEARSKMDSSGLGFAGAVSDVYKYSEKTGSLLIAGDKELTDDKLTQLLRDDKFTNRMSSYIKDNSQKEEFRKLADKDGDFSKGELKSARIFLQAGAAGAQIGANQDVSKNIQEQLKGKRGNLSSLPLFVRVVKENGYDVYDN